MNIDLSKIDNIAFAGIDRNDHPDYCDAYIESADYGGVPMAADQLANLEEAYPDWVYEKLVDYLN